MIVGIDHFGSQLASKNLNGSIANHFVYIHVSLSARTGLPYRQRKMIVELSFNHLIGCLHYSVGYFSVQAKLKVHFSCSFLQDTQ